MTDHEQTDARGPRIDTGPIRVEFRKWDGSLHWHYPMHHLVTDEHGIWLWAPRGTEARRGHEAPKPFATDAVKLIRPGGWWTAIWNGPEYVYVDIATPPRFDGDRIVMVDLDLDVVWRPPSGPVIADEDEFVDHAAAFAYPEHVIAAARAAAARVVTDIDAGAEPFRSAGRDRWRDIPSA